MASSYTFTTDRELRIDTWGDRIAGLTGKPASEVIGKKYHDILPHICQDNADALQVALNTGDRLSLKNYPIKCLHGGVKSNVLISPFMDKHGKLRGIRVRITLFESCPAIEKLRTSQPLIDIGKMASTLAHGVRSPLNAIKGAVVYLREKYADEKTLIEFTKIMEEEIVKLNGFISNFLSTSVSNAGLATTNVNYIVKKIEGFITLQAKSKKISVALDLANVPLVLVDPFQIEHAILNVVNNAIEAMPSGGTLTMRTLREGPADQETVVTEVCDTGRGFARKKLDSIVNARGGRGFGLFITREILQNYDGALEIRSGKGAGTVVRLVLPARSSQE